MKKFPLPTLATLAMFIIGLAVSAPSARAATRADYQKQIETCESIIREFMADKNYAIPSAVLEKARGIVITHQVEAGFILGGRGGYGIIMVKRPNNTWSLPVIIRAAEASVGLQIGGKTVESVCIITDDATPRILFTKRLNIGVDAKAVAGPKYAEAESVNEDLFKTPVLVYVRNKGLMAGATVKAGYMSRNDSANRVFYETEYTMPELLYGDLVETPASVKPLVDYVRQIAPEAAPAKNEGVR